MPRKIVILLSLMSLTGYFITYLVSSQGKKQVMQLQSVEVNRRVDQGANSEINELRKRIDNYVRYIEKFKIDNGGLLPKLDPDIPWVFAVTPTYARFTQKADLTRLAQTLMHVKNLHWIVVEDSSSTTDLVGRLLKESGLTYTHLNFKTPPVNRKNHRGVGQRNTGLKWIRDNVDYKKTRGAAYFMDDDNTYHIKIFDEVGMLWISCLKIKTN